MYKCKYFKIHEIVSKRTYQDKGEAAWGLFDPRILKLIDYLRKVHGTAYINNWFWGGDKQWRGIRYPESAWYTLYSQHTFGRAIDIVFKNVTAEQIRQHIKAHPTDYLIAGDTSSITFENNVSWLHIDVRNNFPGINSFDP